MTKQVNTETLTTSVRYKGVCTQETLAYMLNIPRTTLRDWCKRNNVDLQHGITPDIIEKTYQHFLIEPAMAEFVSHCEFVGSMANRKF